MVVVVCCGSLLCDRIRYCVMVFVVSCGLLWFGVVGCCLLLVVAVNRRVVGCRFPS